MPNISVSDRLQRTKSQVLALWENKARAEVCSKPVGQLALKAALPGLIDDLVHALQLDRPVVHSKIATSTQFSLNQVLIELKIFRKAIVAVLSESAGLSDSILDLILDFIDNAKNQAAGEFVNLRKAAEISRERVILESIHEAFFSVDRNWRFTYVNAHAERLLKLKREDLIGVSLWEIFPEALGTNFSRSYHHAMETGETVQFEEFFPPLKSWYFVKGYPSAQGLSVYFENITEKRAIQLAMRESEDRYKAIVATLREGVIVTDSQTSEILAINESGRELLRLGEVREHQIHGPGNWIPLRPDGSMIERHEYPSRMAAITGRPQRNVEVCLKFDDGSMKWILANAEPMFRAGEAKPYAVVTSFLDISEKKTYEIERARIQKQISLERSSLKKLIMQAPIAICRLHGPNHVFSLVNPLFEQFFTGERELKGHPVREALPELAGQGYFELLDEVYKTGLPRRADESPVRLRHSDGSWRDISVNFDYQPLFDVNDQVEGILVIAADVTPLVLARQAAEAANRMKTAFLANVSHELRTPLGAILGFTDILKDPRLNLDERARYLDVIERNGRALTKVIDDVLDISKVEAGKLDIELMNFSFPGLLREVFALFRDQAMNKGLELILRDTQNLPSQLISDPTRLRQILINLIGNAIKFTEQGRVSVEVETKPMTESRARIFVRIRDTGTGLSQEQANKLFEPFVQGDNSTTRKFGGTGLGLALSRRLARALGGDVVVESCEVGKGCTFLLSFAAELGDRLATRQDVSSQRQRASAGRLNGVRVLLVEDSPDNRFLVNRYLTREGARIDEAVNGQEGLEKALKKEHDVVLMDIQMPVLDGYETIARLRRENYLGPVIALTAHAMKEEREKALLAGFNDHLSKPLSPQDMVDKVAEYAKLNLH